MQCFVYASTRRADTYVWLSRRDRFDALPAALQNLLGDLRLVTEVNLQPQRRLPHEDAAEVLGDLQTQGWHLQLPPG